MFIPDPNFSITDPGSDIFPSRIRIKEFNYFNPKIVSKIAEIWFGLLLPDPDFLPIPDSGVKKALDPGSATLKSLRSVIDTFFWMTPTYRRMGSRLSCLKSSSGGGVDSTILETSFDEEERRKSRDGGVAAQRRRRRSSGLSRYSNEERHVVEAPLRIAAFNVRRWG